MSDKRSDPYGYQKSVALDNIMKNKGTTTDAPLRPSNGSLVDALKEVENEYRAEFARYGAFHSYHEGYAVLLEEVDELWDEVKKRQQDREALRKEAMQIAAMALRFMVDLT